MGVGREQHGVVQANISITVGTVIDGQEYRPFHRSKFRSTQRPIFLAINHGANRDAYGGLDYTMLLSAHTHCIDVTSVLAHSIAASFFSLKLTRQLEFLAFCDRACVLLTVGGECPIFRNFRVVPKVSIGGS